MNFKQYQTEATKTATYPNVGNNFVYPTLGLAGEAGEVAEKIKKVLRDKGGIIDDQTKQDICKEIGDVMWYIAALCNELEVEMNDVAVMNINKLFDRRDRDKIHGEGDDR